MKHRLIVVSTSVLGLALASSVGCSSDEGPAVNIGSLARAGASGVAPGGAGSGAIASSTPGGAGNGTAGPGAGGSGSEGPLPVMALGAAGTMAAAAPGAATAGAGGGAGAGGVGAAGAPGAAGSPSSAAPSLCPDAATNPADGVTCTVTCTDPCGIHNLGTRLCTCTGGAFDCATCDFAVMHPLLTPPATPFSACELPDDAQEDDEAGCTENERCQSVGRMAGASDGGNRFCGCLLNEWDCDTKPAGF